MNETKKGDEAPVQSHCSTAGLGVPIGIDDVHGKPIRIGDTMRFDETEYGEPCEFMISLENGLIQHPGATSDLSNWCEIIKPWDEQ